MLVYQTKHNPSLRVLVFCYNKIWNKFKRLLWIENCNVFSLHHDRLRYTAYQKYSLHKNSDKIKLITDDDIFLTKTSKQNNAESADFYLTLYLTHSYQFTHLYFCNPEAFHSYYITLVTFKLLYHWMGRKVKFHFEYYIWMLGFK